jgi:predicted HTH transcriptional regulator
MKNGKMEIAVALVVLFVAMFNLSIAFSLSLLALVVLGIMRMLAVKKKAIGADTSKDATVGRVEWKQRALENIVNVVKDRGVITNNDVEKLLDVSDATAERYLDELEKDGKLVQEGKTGRSVSYRLK